VDNKTLEDVSYSSSWFGFDPKPVSVVFRTNSVRLGLVSLRLLRFFPTSIIPSMRHSSKTDAM